MQAAILAAGKGTRLYPLTKNIPKVMIDIKGKPLLEYQLRLLKKYHLDNVYINLHAFPHVIQRYFGNGKKYGIKIEYALEKTLLGTAGALHNFKSKLKNDFFVLYGDVFMDVNLAKLLDFHKSKQALFTVVVHEAKHPLDSDLVEIDKNEKIINWIKLPHHKTSGLNSAGLYLINSSVLQYLPKNVPFDFAHDFIPLLLKKIPVFAFITEEMMMDIGTIARYNNLLKIL